MIFIVGSLLNGSIWLGRSAPYFGYVDEGHVLHPVTDLLLSGGWDPSWYGYPSLLLYLVAGVFWTTDFVGRLFGGPAQLALLSSGSDFYDFVTPPSLIVAGRVVILLASLGIIALSWILARRFVSAAAAVCAGLFVALCPALVQRSTIVIVDTLATLLTLGALVASARLTMAQETRPILRALAAGMLAGLAATAKYPAGAVLLAVLATIALMELTLRERIRLAASATAGFFAGLFVGMPAIFIKPHVVLSAIREQAAFYADPAKMDPTRAAPPSLLSQMFQRYELGWVLPILGGIGLLVLLRRETRRVTLPWLVFGAALLIPVLSFPFQPFRNVLPLVPLVCIAAIAALEALGRRGRASRVAAVAAGALLVGSFVPGLVLTYQVRSARDSRVVAIDRLSGSVRRGERVIVLEELAILPSEFSRLKANVTAVPWNEMAAAIDSGKWDLVVFGKLDKRGFKAPGGLDLDAEIAKAESAFANLPETFRVGSVPTPLNHALWRTNDELVIVARRR